MKTCHINVFAASLLSLTATSAIAGEIVFSPVTAPVEDADKRMVRVSPSVRIDGAEHAIKWNVLARSGLGAVLN